MSSEPNYERMTEYKCANCGFHGSRNEFNDIKDAYLRFEPGDIYTDVECRMCGALAFPEWIPVPENADELDRDP